MTADGKVHLSDFKMVDDTPTSEAMPQLRTKSYAEKDRHLGAARHLVGMGFSRATHRLAGFEMTHTFP